MNNCPNCGAQVPEEAQFCPACGHELPAAENRGALAEEQTKVLTDAASQGAVDGNPTGSRRGSNLIESHPANDQLVEGIPADSTPTENNLVGDSPNAGNPNVGNPAESIPTASQAADEELAPVAAKEETDFHQQTEEDEQAMGNAPASHLEAGEVDGSQPDSDSNSDLDSDLDATLDSTSDSTSDATPTVAPAQKPEPAPIPEPAPSATTAQKKNSSGPTFSETSSPEEELLTAATKTKAYASGYFQWLHGNLKAPRLNQHQGPLSYSLISLVIILLANGVAISRLLSTTVQRILTQVQLIGLSYRYNGPQLLFFFEILLDLTLSVAVMVLVYYYVAAKVNSRKISVGEALTEIITPAAFSVYLSLLALVVTFVLPYLPEMGLALITVSLFLVVASFLGNIWRTPATSLKVNRFYTTVIALLIVVLVTVVINRLLLGQMVENLPIQQQLPEGFENFFNQNDSFF